MTLEEELSRRLRARASSARVAPDLDDLASRVSGLQRRNRRRDRAVLAAAIVVLAGSLGGLGGALLRSPAPHPRYEISSGVLGPTGKQLAPGGSSARHGSRAHRSPDGHLASPSTPPLSPETVFSSQLAGGLKVAASLQLLPVPVAVTVAGGGEASCAPAWVVTSTVARAGTVARGMGVVGIEPLSPTGLEVLDSGLFTSSSGPTVWWLTAAVGRSVVQVAATGPGGTVTTVKASGHLAVLAGTAPSAAHGAAPQVSAVTEASSGRSFTSLGVEIGAGPKVVGAVTAVSNGAGAAVVSNGARVRCETLDLPSGSAGASFRAPASPALSASAVVAAYERAYLPQGEASVSGEDESVQAPGSRSGAILATRAPVAVGEVALVSQTTAEVVYRIHGGLWQTGEAVLGADGLWHPRAPSP